MKQLNSYRNFFKTLKSVFMRNILLIASLIMIPSFLLAEEVDTTFNDFFTFLQKEVSYSNFFLKKEYINILTVKSVNFITLEHGEEVNEDTAQSYYKLYYDSLGLEKISFFDKTKYDDSQNWNNYELFVKEYGSYKLFTGVSFPSYKHLEKDEDLYNPNKFDLLNVFFVSSLNHKAIYSIFFDYREIPFNKKKDTNYELGDIITNIFLCDNNLYPVMNIGIHNNCLGYKTEIAIEEQEVLEFFYMYRRDMSACEISKISLNKLFDIVWVDSDFKFIGRLNQYTSKKKIPLWLKKQIIYGK